MPESTLTSKGQITIPKAVRERLHLEAGDTVYFDMRDDGSVLLVPRNEPLERLFGVLKGASRKRKAISIAEMNPASMAPEP
jgi:AbrB family looped-hinge helix DNA binding protein